MAEDVFGICGTEIAGAFEVREMVAEGGFAVVYRAYHMGFRAPIALKCLKVPQRLKAKQRQEFLKQFQAEAELLFQLSATIPTVVRPLHVDAITLADGRFVPIMALEWLEGQTLHSVLRTRREKKRDGYSLEELVSLTTPIARALEKAHHYKGINGPISIVHRDVKPENIFLAEAAGERNVKILDFGIAKVRSVANQVAGRTSEDGGQRVAFTPAYAAPEQWLPKDYGQTGPWTDVWGMALTLVEGLTLRDVLGSDYAAMIGTAINTERRPTPRSEGIKVSDEVEAVFQKAMAVHPSDRYADAGLFWDDLEQALGIGESVRPGQRRAAPGFTAAPRLHATRLAFRKQSKAAPTTAGESPLARGRAVAAASAALNSDEVPELDLPQPEPESGVVALRTVPTKREARHNAPPPSQRASAAATDQLDAYDLAANAVQPIAATVGLNKFGTTPQTPPSDGPPRRDCVDDFGEVELAAISVPPPMGPLDPRFLGERADSRAPPGSLAAPRSLAAPERSLPCGNSTPARRSSTAVPATRPARRLGTAAPPQRPLRETLKLPVRLILAGILVSVIHRSAEWLTGHELQWSGVRVWMFAGALVTAGILILMWRLATADVERFRDD